MTIPRVWPRPGTDIRVLHGLVQTVAGELASMTGGGDLVLPNYLNWAMQSVSRLQGHIPSADVDNLIRTRTFWTALSLHAHDPNAQYLINVEKEDRRNYLNHVVESLAAFKTRFQNVPETAHVLVPDTSMVIRNGDAFSNADWRGLIASHLQPYDVVHIVLPLVVIDELDNLKDRGKDYVRSRARNVLKLVHHLLADHPGERRTLQEPTSTSERVTLEVLMESPDHQRLTIADDEIVAVAERLRNALGHRVAVASTDTGLDFRAATLELRHVGVTFD